jgi:hypothetical protein
MFAVLHSDINSLKSGLLHVTAQPYWKKSRSEKVKDGIINLFLWNYLIDLYSISVHRDLGIHIERACVRSNTGMT